MFFLPYYPVNIVVLHNDLDMHVGIYNRFRDRAFLHHRNESPSDEQEYPPFFRFLYREFRLKLLA